MIKITDPRVANEIAIRGFSYVTEQVNGKTVFAFEDNGKIIEIMRSYYQQTPFYIENKLRF